MAPRRGGVASNDWPAIKRYWARSVAGEFDAEHCAYDQIPEDAPRPDDNAFTVEVWSRAVETLADAVSCYRATRGVRDLWEAVLALGDPLLQVGRHLGRLEARKSEDAISEFLAQLPAVSRAGIALLSRALVDDTKDNEPTVLEEAFETIVLAAGVGPVQDPGGLRVIVRDPDSSV